ncbi:MAG TPA: response regulator transcription factor [Steroidobacteraceae bacterium]|nr:response regulator transcription factor [Steroidobacteraceae bacterium]
MLERRSRVLVVDDDLEMCAMLREYLSKEQFDVELAHDGEAALRQIAANRPDIVLLDVAMPSLGGFDVLRQLRGDSNLPVLMLTARDEHGDRIHGLELGADDYLTKPFNARELVARIHAILRRSQGGPQTEAPEVLHAGLLTLETGLHRVKVGDDAVTLTDAEFRILELLVRSAGRVVTRNEITRRALGRRLLGLDRSVDTHVSNLRRKLGPRIEESTPILGVRGAGYMLGIAEAAPPKS